MLLEGHVENGSIVLDDATPLPEGAKVRVEIVDGPDSAAARNAAGTEYERIRSAVAKARSQPADAKAPTLAQRYAAAMGTAVELPADMAERHDHYIHGSEP